MDAARYARVKALFAEAQELAVTERERFLTEAASTEPDLIDEVRSLLEHVSDASLVEAPIDDTAPSGGTTVEEPVLEPGSQAGDYVIEAQIGAGAFGTVYSGVHPVIGKRVAVKVLNRALSTDASVVSRFVAEARAVNKIDHSGIIDIFAFGQLPDGRHYHVMELIEGGTLRDLAKARGRFSLQDTLTLLRPIARALDAAAAAGIAHRDLKPHNILVADQDGELKPKLLDFGIAKLLDEQDPRDHKTATGAALGTPAYMAPEQCIGRTVDHRADIYAFGVVVYEMLTGELPYDGPNAFMVMAGHVDAAVPSAHETCPEVSPEVAEVLRGLLAKRPEDRPQSLAEALDALATAGGVTLETSMSSAPRSAITAPTLDATTPSPRRPLGWLAGATAAGAIAAAGVAFVQTRSAPTEVSEDAPRPEPNRDPRPVLTSSSTAAVEAPPAAPSAPAPPAPKAAPPTPRRRAEPKPPPAAPRRPEADDIEPWR